jgi:hypothetical protein
LLRGAVAAALLFLSAGTVQAQANNTATPDGDVSQYTTDDQGNTTDVNLYMDHDSYFDHNREVIADMVSVVHQWRTSGVNQGQDFIYLTSDDLTAVDPSNAQLTQWVGGTGKDLLPNTVFTRPK